MLIVVFIWILVLHYFLINRILAFISLGVILILFSCLLHIFHDIVISAVFFDLTRLLNFLLALYFTDFVMQISVPLMSKLIRNCPFPVAFPLAMHLMITGIAFLLGLANYFLQILLGILAHCILLAWTGID